jgi:IclR family KDG regulon transcriptional repressor
LSVSNYKPREEMVKSAARVLDVFEFLSDHPGGSTLTDISKQLQVPVSSMHNLIRTLVKRGYLRRDQLSMIYQLGPKIGQLVGNFVEQVDIIQLANPQMIRLSQLTGETTSLTILRDDEIVFIHKVVGESVVQIVNPVGTTLAAHATGSGKVMLSYLPFEELDHIYPNESLPKLTINTIDNKTKLKIALKETAELGYAFDNEESHNGIWAIAACIRDVRGRPVAALSVVGLVGRVSSKDTRLWPNYIKEMAKEVSAALGYRPSKHAEN